MNGKKGDHLRVHSHTIGVLDTSCEILEVLGEDGQPPYFVRFEDGQQAILHPPADAFLVHQ